MPRRKATKSKKSSRPRARLYTIATVREPELVAGRCADGRQVLIGLFCPDVLAVFFGKDGALLSIEARACDPPPAGRGTDRSPYRVTPEFDAGFARQTAAWRQELGWVERPIRVRGFHDETTDIQIIPVPDHLLDTSWGETAEERAEAEADRRAWERNGQYVLRWANDFYMSRDGEVEAT